MEQTQFRKTARSTEEILGYRHDRLMRRHAADHGVSVGEAERRFYAFKQFIVVCAAKEGPKVTSVEIDGVWHSFLLFTKDYRSFCDDYLGRFINHEPFHEPQPDAYAETRRCAEQIFGRLDPDLWPVDAKTDCSSGCAD